TAVERGLAIKKASFSRLYSACCSCVPCASCMCLVQDARESRQQPQNHQPYVEHDRQQARRLASHSMITAPASVWTSGPSDESLEPVGTVCPFTSKWKRGEGDVDSRNSGGGEGRSHKVFQGASFT
ncbi:unnamed protein product, partial [Sphacelaria rigidula]